MNGSGQRADAHRSTFEFLNNRQQKLSIHFIQAVGVDFHSIQGVVSHFMCNAAVIIDVGVVAYAPQQTIDDARCAARTASNFMGTAIVDFNIQDAG